jgi:hypothetical protein
MIAFITFLNDKIVVQEYIYGANVPYMHVRNQVVSSLV